MSNLDEKFRHLEIFPGVLIPLTRDARDLIVAQAVAGASSGNAAFAEAFYPIKQQLNGLLEDGLYAYLADMLGMPDFAGTADMFTTLRSKRAAHVGLPEDSNWETVLDNERRCNRCLTIGELRIARDKRNGTHIPLVNGQW